ncbi:MAG: Gfo/Idh/MocA family oxidoreductase, partial [Planctomycetes bacterium]|nr:Gfo/Idh/MocA family oxidoreductase [Planctomycetota bacterium]
PNVTAVSIATPDFAHLAPALQLIAAGKHVLCEKPLATTLEDARRIHLAAQKANITLMVDFHNRFNPACLETKRRLERLGRPIYGSICLSNTFSVPGSMLSWASKSGPQWFLLPHIVDLARWYAGAEPAAVSAVRHDGLLKKRGIDAADSIQALLDFDGCCILVESSWILPESWPSVIEFEGKIVCENGRVGFSLHNQGVTVNTQAECQYPFTGGSYDVAGQTTGFFHLPINHFIDCIARGRQPLTTGRDGLMTTMIIEAALRSAAEQRRVALDELMHPTDLEIEKIEEDQGMFE